MYEIEQNFAILTCTLQTHPPIYARVIKARTPISYDSQALTLKLDDIIRITRRSHGQGVGEILGTDKVCKFQLHAYFDQE